MSNPPESPAERPPADRPPSLEPPDGIPADARTEGAGSAGASTHGWRGRLATARQSRAWRIGRWPVLAFATLLILGIAAFAVFYATIDLPDELPPVESAVLYDHTGEELALFQQDGLRFEVALDEVSPSVVDALIAAEDRRFYDHGGIDPIGLVRAISNNVRGGDTQGASTLTQQLVKNTYLSSERTMTRKVREAVLAFKLERRDDKDAILERYLNTVYFGRGAYGIEAAARVYFATSAAELETAQAALLVGMLRAPEAADPDRNPDEAERRRDVVLQAMAQTGALTESEADQAATADLETVPRDETTLLTAGVAPHFVERVRAEAIAMFGEDVVYGGGLRITTTLDIEDQRAAEGAVAMALTEPDEPQAAVVGIDRSGAVRAYVGGRDFDELQVDLASAQGGSGRQPGSTFKTFVLAAALEEGIHLGTRYPAPAQITLDTGGEPWEVANYGNQGFGDSDLTSATARSINTTYAQLVLDVGPEKVADLAQRAGITSEVPAHPSIALGTSELSPLELANAYLTFARDGERVEPFTIARVETTTGDVLFQRGDADPERTIEEGPARAVNHALQTVLTDGTGTAARLDRPAAGKTGTTQGNGDAWFAGYTPEYSAVVWMGYPEGPERAMTDVQGRSVTGGGLPAQIWQGFMTAALVDVEPTDFEPPPAELLESSRRPQTELVGEPRPTSPPPPPPPPVEDGGADDGADEGDDEPPPTTTPPTTTTSSTTTPSTTTTTAAPTTTTSSTTTSSTTSTTQAQGAGGGGGRGGGRGGSE
jgi:penicillin-binding protein 1A